MTAIHSSKDGTATKPKSQPRPQVSKFLVTAIFFFIAASSVSAQSLGELARKEREKKKSQPPTARVYTDEDMKRSRILDPADRARFEASRQQNSPAKAATRAEATTLAPSHAPVFPPPAAGVSTTTAPVPADLQPPSPNAPLGDVARYYRAKKLLREASERAEAAHAAPAPRASVPAAARPRVNNPVRVAPPLDATPARAAKIFSTPATRARDVDILVRRGDTLWGLARLHLGKGTRWTELAAANPAITDAHRLQAGAIIRLPASLQADGTEFRVRADDTLWSLAATKYGSGASWTCIASANPQLANPDLIHPGESLLLPASCATLP